MNAIEQLQTLYQDQSFQSIFDHFASRERNWKITRVDRILKNVNQDGGVITRHDVVRFFKEMQLLGHGVFKAGRRGWPSRFVWSSRMTDVGKTAAGKEGGPRIVTEDHLCSGNLRHGVNHAFRLRPGHVVRTNLPVDLTQREADRLGSFFRTLVLG